MTVRNIKKSLAGTEDLALGVGTLTQERGTVHRVNVFPSSYSYIDMQQYEGGDFFRLYGSDVFYTDYRRNPTGTVGIPADAGGVWEPLRSSDRAVGGNFTDGAYLVDAESVAWHADTTSYYSWTGTLPYEVAPGTDPTSPGSGYVLRTGVVLRDDLSNLDSKTLIGGVPADSLERGYYSTISLMDFIPSTEWAGIIAGTSSYDSTGALQLAVNAVSSSNAAAPAKCLKIPGYKFYVSSEVQINSKVLYIEAESGARIQPISLTTSDTYTIFNLADGVERGHVSGLNIYLFGSNVKAFSGRAWRQFTFKNCYWTGGYAASFTSGLDCWGIVFAKCRFQDCIIPIDVIIHGQTFKLRDCLFFNSQELDVRISDASQVSIDGCVFENAGASRGKMLIADSIDELNISNTQSERLYPVDGAINQKSDYDVQLTNCTVKLDSSRLWGGNYGSVSPGNSRQYGVYLDNSSLTIASSRVYSFREFAIYGANASRIYSDLSSRIDYKIGGDITIESSANIGENLIHDGAFEKYRNSSSAVIPFSWSLPGAGTATRITSGLIGSRSVAALVISDGNIYETNSFNVYGNEWIAVRFMLKITQGSGIRCVLMNADTSTSIDEVMGGSINISGSDAKHGLISDAFKIPAGVKRVFFRFVRSTGTSTCQIEEVAAYRVRSQKKTGSVYSANDSTYGFMGGFCPLLPYSSRNAHIGSAAPTVDSWTIKDRVEQRVPAVGSPKSWICTASGEPGTWVSEGNL